MKKRISNIYHYIVGMWRYQIYYNMALGFLIRDHIREQIEFRINSMDRECYTNGSCRMCGCMTTALQMASKPCDGRCYPKMLKKSNWEAVRNNKHKIIISDDMYTYWEADFKLRKFTDPKIFR